jgi:hypothetical protein
MIVAPAVRVTVAATTVRHVMAALIIGVVLMTEIVQVAAVITTVMLGEAR